MRLFVSDLLPVPGKRAANARECCVLLLIRKQVVVDFACRERMLVVEIDGSQHAESARDEAWTALLNAEGYSVLRFWNDEVLADLTAVYDLLRAVAEGKRLSPGWRFSPATLSPAGRGDVASLPAGTGDEAVSSARRGDETAEVVA